MNNIDQYLKQVEERAVAARNGGHDYRTVTAELVEEIPTLLRLLKMAVKQRDREIESVDGYSWQQAKDRYNKELEGCL